MSEVVVRAIEAADKFGGFSLGDAAFQSLKSYLQNHARNHHDASLARTYCAIESANPNVVIGYMTLVCGQVQTRRNVRRAIDGVDFSYDHCPAVKIARLAIRKSFQSSGIGRRFVGIALGIAKDYISPNVGCRFVIVDAKQQAVAFYERQGFTMLNTAANKRRGEPLMFVDLLKA